MRYRVGEVVSGRITGIQPYGAFVELEDKTAGLIHISELSDSFVRDVEQFVSVKDQVLVKIIDYDKKSNQARCSLKAVRPGQFRKERNFHRYHAVPQMKIGFRSIQEKMNQWIEEAKEDMK